MYLTDFVSLTGIVENTLSGCGLTGIDVRHDTDVSGEFKISSHCTLLFSGLESEVCKCLVGLCHSVHVFLSLECCTLAVVCGDDFSTKFFGHGVA